MNLATALIAWSPAAELLAPGLVAAALVSSLCWAGFDALRKRLSQHLDSSLLVAAFSLGQAPLFASLWLVSGPSAIDTGYWIPGLSSLALNLVANLLFVGSVRRSELSVVIPLLSFTPVFSTLAAVVFLDELPTAVQSAGIAVVVAGALVLSWGPSAQDGQKTGPPAWRDPGVWMMLGVAGLWSLTIVLDKAATKHTSLAFHGLMQTGALGLIVSLYVLRGGVARASTSIRKTAWPLLLACAVAASAYGLQLLALQGIAAGLIETQKRVIGLVLALMIGRMFFGEAIGARKWFAVVIMGLGTAMTVLGSPELVWWSA